MKKLQFLSQTLFLLLLLPLIVSSIQQQQQRQQDREAQVYIVNVGGGHNGEKALEEIESSHHSYLLSVKETEEEARASLLYSYQHSINGFAAVLTPDEASKISELEEVESVYPSDAEKYTLHTTRSWEWDFVGLEKEQLGFPSSGQFGEDLLSRARYGSEVIVGVLDSGNVKNRVLYYFTWVWPESQSFSDQGMGPIPTSWKGICQPGVAFKSSHCNKKIIGARYYLKQYEQSLGPLNVSMDYRSPRDMDGHGTHTASTVGGRRVSGVAAIGGFANGTASGGAPLVRLAIYKACWAIPNQEKAGGNTCFEADMLAAIDDAIRDGVHVLSVSIGTTKPVPYAQDGIARGALEAARRDIVTVCSAGNAGPVPSTLSNQAPWILTVGASSLDRKFIAPVVLGNGVAIQGQTVTPYSLNDLHPIVYASDVSVQGLTANQTGQCLPNSIIPEKAKGKIVLCMRGLGTRVGKGMEAKRAGAVGFILANSPEQGHQLTVDPHVLPATAVTDTDGRTILAYIRSTKNPVAAIFPGKTYLFSKPAPFMAGFTSQGPNSIEPIILKPDITAPGLNILAAWSGGVAPTKLSNDHRVVKYNILSGTSMSCPHVAAAAALLRAIHPKWSSAAIRSALMTTSTITNNIGQPLADETGKPSTPFSYGSGHFQPAKAAEPGLVYDASHKDYLLHLCSVDMIKNMTGSLPKGFKCPGRLPSPYDLNYPSVSIPKLKGNLTVRRTVTYVGGGKEYFLSVKQPLGFSVEIVPSKLSFKRVGQRKSFTVTVTASSPAAGLKGDEYAFGWFSWRDSASLVEVRSPIAVSSA